ncbi:unnamed protein product, partial [Protopolystoma xenopodis]
YQQALAKERTCEQASQCKFAELNEELAVNEKSRLFTEAEKSKEAVLSKLTKLEARHTAAKACFAEYQAQDSRIRDDFLHAKNACRRLNNALRSEQVKMEEFEKLPSQSEERRSALKSILMDLEKNKTLFDAAYQTAVEQLSIETEPLRARIEKAEKALTPIQLAADEAQRASALDQQKLQLATASQHREEARASLAKSGASRALERLASLRAELAASKQTLGRIDIDDSSVKGDKGKTAHLSTRRSLSEMMAQPGNKVAALASANRDLTEVRQQEAKLTERVYALRTKVAEEKSRHNASIVLAYIKG